MPQAPTLQTSRQAQNTNLTPAAGPSAEPGWKKELANAFTSVDSLLCRLGLEHLIPECDQGAAFRCLVTESYVKKMEAGNGNDPLLRQVLPTLLESDASCQQSACTDPVGDIAAMNSPGLLHKYSGRALLISTGACAIHCRYCFRRHYPYQDASCTGQSLDDAIDYLLQHKDIDEIILSGGDPLVIDNEKLQSIITRLESVPQLQTLRIHSRLPVVLPQRIDHDLIELLRSSRLQTVMVIHANHAREIQLAESRCLQRLHDAGITLLNQSVLLKGINDDADSLVELSKALFRNHTLPYYLHFLDPVSGAMHFSTSRQQAIECHRLMQQQLPGYLVPRLVQEIAGKTSKTTIFRI